MNIKIIRRNQKLNPDVDLSVYLHLEISIKKVKEIDDIIKDVIINLNLNLNPNLNLNQNLNLIQNRIW